MTKIKKQRMNNKKKYIALGLGLTGLVGGLTAAYQIKRKRSLLIFTLTCGTITYHYWMRFFTGALFDTFMGNRADYNKKWYRVSHWESEIYRVLQVHKWKRWMPSFDSDSFDPTKHTWSEIAQAMCQSELVHETIMVLSFVPVIASVKFGGRRVFIKTSMIAAGIDFVFVIMQRYNRPRIIAIIDRLEKRNAKPDR